MSEIISKTVISFTILHRTDEPIEDLPEALARAFDGHTVGQETGIATTPLEASSVADELVGLGNDGTFFDADLGIEDDN